jgi:hypothetical protein
MSVQPLNIFVTNIDRKNVPHRIAGTPVLLKPGEQADLLQVLNIQQISEIYGLADLISANSVRVDLILSDGTANSLNAHNLSSELSKFRYATSSEGAVGESQVIMGKPGSQILVGDGIPSNSLGSEGDFYLDSSTGRYYKKTFEWGQSLGTLAGPQGPQGERGIGEPGPQGPRGEAGTPSTIAGPQGAPGQRGERGERGEPGERGERGEQGERGGDGKPGSSIICGSGSPDKSLGNSGDIYLDSSSGGLYSKSLDWSSVGSLAGPKGDKGDRGDIGPAGEVKIRGIGFVSKNGDDSTGMADNLSRPFKTISAAIKAFIEAGHNAPNNPAMIFVHPGVYVEDLSLSPNIHLSAMSGILDYSVTIQGSHKFIPVNGVANSNQLSLVGIQFKNPLNSEPTISFLGEVPGKIRINNCAIDMGNCMVATNPTILMNNVGSGASIEISNAIGQGEITRSSASGDAIKVLAGSVSIYGCDVSSLAGTPINLVSGMLDYSHGSISTQAGAQAILISDQSQASVSHSDIVNGAHGNVGIKCDGAVSTVSVKFSVNGNTAFCVAGSGLWASASNIFAGTNSSVQSTLKISKMKTEFNLA